MTTELTLEEISKDLFFKKLADLSTEMIKEHGKDVAMTARFIAEDKPFDKALPAS